VSDSDDRFGGFVTEADGYMPMVEEAGFHSIEWSEITDGFHTMALRWLEVAQDLEHDLRSGLGDDVFEDKLQSRMDTKGAIEAGEIKRLLFTATA
jgi:hypothetical protein